LFTYILLTLKNLDEILLLQNEVTSKLDNEDTFRASSKEMLEKFLTNGYIMGAIANNKLIAYRILYTPNEDIDNLGYDLKFNAQDFKKVIHFETAIVHPDFRGNGLQVLLTEEIKKHISIEDKIICATCYPLNYPSLSNLLKLGLTIQMLKMKYNNNIRFILSNKIIQIIPNEIISCKADDFEKIKSLIENGYIGTKVVKSENSKIFNISFQKRELIC